MPRSSRGSLQGPIFLLGMMGAGKSSVGRALVARLGAPSEQPEAGPKAEAEAAAGPELSPSAGLEAPVFIDLDLRIERMFGASVPALFANGEDYFRACERAALRTLLDEPGFRGSRAVVATGGGVVVDPANVADMVEAGTCVYLEVPVATLVGRLRASGELERRPLLGARDLEVQLGQLDSQRRAAYERAGLCVDARGPVAVVVEAVLAALRA